MHPQADGRGAGLASAHDAKFPGGPHRVFTRVQSGYAPVASSQITHSLPRRAIYLFAAHWSRLRKVAARCAQLCGVSDNLGDSDCWIERSLTVTFMPWMRLMLPERRDHRVALGLLEHRTERRRPACVRRREPGRLPEAARRSWSGGMTVLATNSCAPPAVQRDGSRRCRRTAHAAHPFTEPAVKPAT